MTEKTRMKREAQKAKHREREAKKIMAMNERERVMKIAAARKIILNDIFRLSTSSFVPVPPERIRFLTFALKLYRPYEYTFFNDLPNWLKTSSKSGYSDYVLYHKSLRFLYSKMMAHPNSKATHPNRYRTFNRLVLPCGNCNNKPNPFSFSERRFLECKCGRQAHGDDMYDAIKWWNKFAGEKEQETKQRGFWGNAGTLDPVDTKARICTSESWERVSIEKGDYADFVLAAGEEAQ